MFFKCILLNTASPTAPQKTIVPEDDGIEPRTVVTLSLAVRHSFYSARAHSFYNLSKKLVTNPVLEKMYNSAVYIKGDCYGFFKTLLYLPLCRTQDCCELYHWQSDTLFTRARSHPYITCVKKIYHGPYFRKNVQHFFLIMGNFSFYV
jgi:hypothetical protein